MKILLVYPQYPDTFWSFRHALRFIAKKASFPPLGLLTVAAMLPADWSKKLVDMNVSRLTDEDIKWADYVFISAMVVQESSVRTVIARCRGLGVKTVAGGPLFTTAAEDFPEIDHLVLGEAEATLPGFLADLSRGAAGHIYNAPGRPDVARAPIPDWSLLNIKNYSSMNIQYSRGCPFNCEFCDIVILNGRVPRTKERSQVICELEALYHRGWRGSVFVVDDNFIGNRMKLKTVILPAIIRWSKNHGHPFTFYTEASIDLADDEELMRLMTEAGFNTVFVGIETPNEDSLVECNKLQNKGRDLAASVKKLQNHGIEVQGGFILGFDSDPASIFRSQINFIQKSGIVTAMVSLLNAPRGTRLYQRLQKENRLLGDMSGDNTDCSMNFVPRMDRETLITGYKEVLDTIYSPPNLYARIRTFLKEYHPPRLKKVPHLQWRHIHALVRSFWILGVVDKGRTHYWRLLLMTLFRHPRSLHLSIGLSVFGFHFRKVAERFTKTPASSAARPG